MNLGMGAAQTVAIISGLVASFLWLPPCGFLLALSLGSLLRVRLPSCENAQCLLGRGPGPPANDQVKAATPVLEMIATLDGIFPLQLHGGKTDN